MRISLLSPFHSGSHQAWAEGYAAASRHQVALFTRPGRFWKWRMHGGAVSLARRWLAAAAPPDLILATDMLDATTFLALTRPVSSGIPLAVYMHENQLTYPLPAEGGPMRRQHGERDYHYVFINYASMLAADQIFFNSAHHRDSWFTALPRYLKRFPDDRELGSVDRLRARSQVLPVGIDLGRLDRPLPAPTPPLVLWNQRWEYDKNPTAFFQALDAVAERGIPFQVALCGENFRRRPAEFDAALARLGDRVIHAGYADPKRYGDLLWQARVTVSTASHEFFGISILEAVYCRTLPLLPRRLSYPELIPADLQPYCLYDNQADLVERLAAALTAPPDPDRLSRLAAAAAAYDWRTIAPRYDDAFEQLSAARQTP